MFLLFCALLAAADGPQAFDLHEGTLSYVVVHKLHEVKGTTHAVEGRALVQPGGGLRVQVRAKVATFDSGNSNRDEHMREVTHEPVHPYVQIKASAAGVTLPLAAPVELKLDGTLDFNGLQQPEKISVKLEPSPDGVRARFSFPISLGAFKVERPELLLVKIDDKATIEGELVFAKSAK
jgi:hypothetical protein